MRDDRDTLSAGLHLSLSLAGCKNKEKHGDEVERKEPRPQDPVAVDSGNCRSSHRERRHHEVKGHG
uniref:Lipoprotein n=1 Tax=Musa acuminata subsp. malaccensis TaxID=214687 RepID=A0A804K1K6_MUSAM